MAQTSYFWDNNPSVIGHAKSSYTDDEYALFLSILLNYDRTTQAPVFSRSNAFFSLPEGAYCLTPSNPSGTTLRISPGIAIVDGRPYASTENIDHSCSTSGYYRIVLRRDTTAQTVRQVKLYSPSAYPTLTQTSTVWEVSIARAISNGTSLTTFIDDRRFINNNIYVRARAGGHPVHWDVPTVASEPGVYGHVRPVGPTAILVGSIAPATNSKTVYFPRKFVASPIVIVSLANYSGTTPDNIKAVSITAVDETKFTFFIDSIAYVTAVNWMAIGPLYYGTW